MQESGTGGLIGLPYSHCHNHTDNLSQLLSDSVDTVGTKRVLQPVEPITRGDEPQTSSSPKEPGPITPHQLLHVHLLEVDWNHLDGSKVTKLLPLSQTSVARKAVQQRDCIADKQA